MCYCCFGDFLLLLELVNVISVVCVSGKLLKVVVGVIVLFVMLICSNSGDKSYVEWNVSLFVDMKDLFILLEDYIGFLGDDV